MDSIKKVKVIKRPKYRIGDPMGTPNVNATISSMKKLLKALNNFIGEK